MSRYGYCIYCGHRCEARVCGGHRDLPALDRIPRLDAEVRRERAKADRERAKADAVASKAEASAIIGAIRAKVKR